MKWYAFKILMICVMIWILQIIHPSLTGDFSLVRSEFLVRPWTIATYIFLHGDFEHLFYNMFALALFGSILEKLIGEKRFLITFFVSGLIAGIGSLLFYSESIGASGAIYGVMGTLAILRPRMIVFVGFGIPLPLIIAVSLWTLGDLLGLFAPFENVAYAAHLFGLAFGLLCGLYLKKEYGEKKKLKKPEIAINEKEFREWEDRWLKSSDSDF